MYIVFSSTHVLFKILGMEYDFVAHTEPLHNNALQYLIKRSIFIIHESVLHEILTLDLQCLLTRAAIINHTIF